MANLNITIDTSKMTPFSFQEKVAPLIMYKEAFDKLNAKLEDYAEKYGTLPNTQSERLQSIVDKYNEDLRYWSDDFSSGMNSKNAAALRDLFVRGRAELTPIKNAIKEYNDYRTKVASLGPDAIMADDDNITVDSFYDGYVPTYKYRSGKDIIQQSKNYFTGINNALMKSPSFKLHVSQQFYEGVQKGMDKASALTAALSSYAQRDPNASGAVQNLQKHMIRLMEGQDLRGFSDRAKEQIWTKIGQGLVESLTPDKYTMQGNPNYITDYQKQQRDDAQVRLRDSNILNIYMYDAGGTDKIYGQYVGDSQGNGWAWINDKNGNPQQVNIQNYRPVLKMDSEGNTDPLPS